MNASHPATRLLAALELLQARGRLSGAELARRLGVERRTVRRYMARLEEMGVPIMTERGAQGGYALVGGYRLPPLMFTNDEALAISLGLLASESIGLVDGLQAVQAARAKLERVLPASIRARVRAVAETVALEDTGSAPPGESVTLLRLSSSAHAGERVRIGYRSRADAVTEREFDPYALVYRGRRWYAVGHCHLRRGLRSFRVDRIAHVEAAGRTFERPAAFDAVAYMNRALATLPRAFRAHIVLRTDLAAARAALFPAFGVLEATNGGVSVRCEVDDLDWLARELARLPWPFEIRRPPELRQALARHVERLAAGARRPAPAPAARRATRDSKRAT